MQNIQRIVALSIVLCPAVLMSQEADYPIKPVKFTEVNIEDDFWLPRLETNRKVTLPFNFRKCEETGRIENFEIAAGMKQGEHIGIRFNDSDVFKIMEGAAYSLANHPDPELDRYMDDLIAKIAAAQEDDGYLYTARTINPEKPARAAGEVRWSFLDQNHELYNVGHMYEAAVAHFQATGKRNFLDIAIKNADLIANTFGPDLQYGFPGHQEIEIGLVKLYRVTGDRRYLDLAKYFLDIRGVVVDDVKFPQRLDRYDQSHIPVFEQTEAVGHAVRATYMYSGMADIAAITGDEKYVQALDKIWHDIVDGKLYLTGGIGSSRHGEAFGNQYELPNGSAYNETCAAIGNMFWNYRMFLLSGESRYMDVFERTLYNGFLAGVSLEGDEFFYPNPLSSDGLEKFNQGLACRSPWFDCSCCPSNIVRFLPSLPGYVYAHTDGQLYVNLFMENTGHLQMGKHQVEVIQQTDYPWDGAIALKINPSAKVTFDLMIRLPGWALNKVVPTDLYRFADQQNSGFRLSVNGTAIPDPTIEHGYLKIGRKWKKGDQVHLQLDMPVRMVEAHEAVKADRGRVAIERGPLVYCAEWVDNNGQVTNIMLPRTSAFDLKPEPDLLSGIVTINSKVPAATIGDDGISIMTAQQPFTAIPYYAWSHRGIGEMAVWLPEKASRVLIFPPTHE
jgi:DUF1680 family protein